MLEYIASIKEAGEAAGIVKIVPPAGEHPRLLSCYIAVCYIVPHSAHSYHVENEHDLRICRMEAIL